MKIRYIKYWAFAAVLGMGTVSCEDFLNRPTEDNYNESNFYQNDEQCVQGVNYLYNSPWYDFQRGFIKVGEILSGNVYEGNSPYLNFTVNGTDENLVNMSYSLWAVIGHANTVYTRLKTIYGTGRSKFRYYDTRNILFDWDGSHGGMAIAHGWRDGSKVLREADENSIDGAYICLTGALDGAIGATWAEDEFSFNYWPEPSAGYPELSARPEFAELLEEYGVNGLQLKFEVNIPSSNPWQSCALQVMFTGNDVVTYATGTNAYFSDTNVPRGLWLPWKNTGSYDTGGKWTTVSMNLSEFNKTHEGNKCDRTFDKTMLTGLTFFVWAGGVEGKDCNPVIMIDNIRVVPIE